MKQISIVLANLMSRTGELNPESAARVDLAIKNEKTRESDYILLCGWPYRLDCTIAIADAMKEYLLSMCPGFLSKTRCQRFSRDTVGDAVFSRIFLEDMPGDLTNYMIKIVTSDYHVDRAREIFNFVFNGCCTISVVGAPGFQRDDSLAKEADSMAAFRKTFENVMPGDLSSIFSTLRNNHPFYNGIIYPQIESYSDLRAGLMCYNSNI